MGISVEEAAKSECPMMFISFPSAKDPEWEQKYPGKCQYTGRAPDKKGYQEQFSSSSIKTFVVTRH